MIALAEARWSEEGRSGLLPWILPASVLMHAVIFAWMPSARRLAPMTPAAPLVIEVAELPPPPPPPPALPATQDAPQDEAPAARPASAAVATLAPARELRPSAAATAAAAPASDAPMDFTSTVFSNDGPGLAVGGGAGAARVAPAGAAAALAPPVAAGPRFVPAASLARRPRAPGLDAELERQYPVEARRSGISGSAVLRVRVLPSGRIGAVQVVSETWSGFGRACERTVRAAPWEAPIDHDGATVTTEITYTCRFEVRT